MRLTKVDDCYVCICSFNDRSIPKMAGFRWNDPVPGRWATKSERAAMALAKYADDSCREQFAAAHHSHQVAVEASWRADTDFQPPCPEGLAYMPFQRAGIEAIVRHRGVAFLADPPGLGKTIQAIGAINILKPRTVLVVCPASLKLNWRDEIKKWLTVQYDITVMQPRSAVGTIKHGIFICNYDIILRFPSFFQHRWGMCVVDESHYIKGVKTKTRWGAVKSIKADMRLPMSGTPMPQPHHRASDASLVVATPIYSATGCSSPCATAMRTKTDSGGRRTVAATRTNLTPF
jgi:SWI/SNF-related matrix-associated actin-dependent regulator 1 of chromatin subfamily A